MPKRQKKESLVLAKLLAKLAPAIGARVLIEPRWGMAGQITFMDGRRSYFRYNTLDLNPVGSSDIAKDKDFSAFFLKRMGYPVVPGSRAFFSRHWSKAVGAPRLTTEAAYRHARCLGFPVVVKPNSGSQGVGVTFVYTRQEFMRAITAVFKKDRVALVQRPLVGNDYRVVVLDDGIVSAYRRIPLNVVGDGRSSVLGLIAKKQRDFDTSSRDTRINLRDPRIREKLRRQGLTLQSRLERGRIVYLLDNANLSTGGDAVDVTDRVHPEFRRLCINVTRDMGLRLCGVDLLVSGDISDPPGRFWILEINAAPGLDHYVRTGKAQAAIVEGFYLTVLKHLEHRIGTNAGQR